MNKDLSNPVSGEQLNNILDQLIKKFSYIITAVLIVLIIGFMVFLISVSDMVINAIMFKASTYQNLVNKVDQQNTKIDNLQELLSKTKK